MPVERRGQVTGIEVVRVNGKPEELDDLDGRRQPLVGGTSRISREAYVRFCERLGVQFPGPTRRWETGRRLGVSARAHPRLYRSGLRKPKMPPSGEAPGFPLVPKRTTIEGTEACARFQRGLPPANIERRTWNT